MQKRLLYLIIILLGFVVLKQFKSEKTTMVGVYWGAFDPPTEAHLAIIETAIKDIPLEKLYVIVNNHGYKRYANSLEGRVDLLRQKILSKGIKHVEIAWQDEQNPMDYTVLRKKINSPICAISGYDSYQAWVNHSQPDERSLYDAIAVVPRGDETTKLVDDKAFILHIDKVYRHVSSTKLRGYSSLRIEAISSKESSERNDSTK